MLIHPRGKDRPYHLGPFPLETLQTNEWRSRRRGGTPGPLPLNHKRGIDLVQGAAEGP